MLRLLLRIILGILLLALAGAAVAPLVLIDPSPLPADKDARETPAAEPDLVTIPFAGTTGIDLHVRDSGSGDTQPASRTFVLLHGFTFNLFTWDAVDIALREHGRVLAYDQVPYGLSAKPVPGDWLGPHPYTRAGARERLFALLDRAGIERAVLVGNSSGANLALEAALAHPDRVEGLVLIAPWVYSQRPTLPSWLARLPQMQRLMLWVARQLGGTVPLLDRSYADPARIDARRRALAGVHRASAGWDLAWASLLTRSLSDPVEVAAHLGEIDAPALVVAGSADRIVPVADSRAAADALPRATYVELPGCGHAPQEECPDALLQAVEAWFDTLHRDGA